jgi:predicted site-specific integrase-resolvase
MNIVNKNMKAKEVLKVLGISRSTLYRYKRDGIISIKTKFNDNFHEYDDDSVYRLLGDSLKKHNKQVVSYARVSTQNQKKQLQEQNQRIYDSCISRGLVLDRQFSDIKSGMSADRKEFQEMMNLII